MDNSNTIMVGLFAFVITGIVAFAIVPQYNERLDQPADPTVETTADPKIAAAKTEENNQTDEPTANRAAVLRKKDDGHYWGEANVDGFPVKFMVDTGASVVVLTYKDAKRLRMKPDELDFKWKISTAGGEVKGASVLLEYIRIGGVEVENVEAMILREGLEQNLLGQSFLNQLYSYEVRGKQMIIRQ